MLLQTSYFGIHSELVLYSSYSTCYIDRQTFLKLDFKFFFFFSFFSILYLKGATHPWNFEMGLTLDVICCIINYLQTAHTYHLSFCGSELQGLAYTTATPDPSCICDPTLPRCRHRNSQHQYVCISWCHWLWPSHLSFLSRLHDSGDRIHFVPPLELQNPT